MGPQNSSSALRIAAALGLALSLAGAASRFLGDLKAAEVSFDPGARIAAGGLHSLVVAADGSVWAWGENDRGQLGDGTRTNRTSPVQVAGLDGVIAVAAGAQSSYAVRSDGTLWAWGANQFGSLGDGTTIDRLLPVQVLGLSDVVAVAAGANHALAVDGNGALWSWGHNAGGQLGDGTRDDRALAAPVALSHVRAVAGGGGHTLVAQEDGSLWAFGANGSGQLGIGSNVDSLVPVLVTTIDEVTAIEAGMAHSVALRSDGSVWSFGANAAGQLGDGSFRERSRPVRVNGVASADRIAAGYYHSFAIAPGGSVWAWGLNLLGELGDGTTAIRRNTPVALTTLAEVVALSGGGAHNLALTSSYQLYGWGLNASGQVGDGTRNLRRSPVLIDVPDLSPAAGTPSIDPPGGTFSAPVSVALASATPDALIHYTLDGSDPEESDPYVLSGGEVLVDQSLTLKARAFALNYLPSDVASAVFHLQAAPPGFDPGGGLYTSPVNVALSSATPDAAIHYTTDGSDPSPASPLYQVPVPIQTATDLRARAFRDGFTPSEAASAIYTFDYGVLASPSIDPDGGTFVSSVEVELFAPMGEIRFTTDGSQPTPASILYVSPLTLTTTTTLKAAAFAVDWTPSPPVSADFVIQVATPSIDPDGGLYHSEQTVTLWCDTPGARVHYTTGGADPTEADPSVLPGETIVVAESITLKARGFAPGTTPSGIAEATFEFVAATPTALPRGGFYWRPVEVVLASSTPGAEIRFTTDGSEPDGSSALYTAPLPVDSDVTIRARAYRSGFQDSDVRSETYRVGAGGVAAGGLHSLALWADGSVWSWGANDAGQLGDAAEDPRTVPGLVAGLPPALVLSAGERHSLALAEDGTIWTWGANESGQLGDGTNTSRFAPSPVSGLSGVVAIAASGSHSLALASDGALWSWGENAEGQLGDGTTSSRAVPGRVSELAVVVTMAAGSRHSLALDDEGALWSWGDNASGQLGDGGYDSTSVPVPIELGDEVIAMAAGDVHSLAITADGAVWSWGDNGSGQLGSGEGYGSSNTPVSVVVECEECSPEPFSDARAVAAGRAHSLALKADGTVWAWGEGSAGQIGDGQLESRPSPVLVDLPGPMLLIAAGGDHNLALGVDGTVWAWGANEEGQIGDGTTDVRPRPVSISEAELQWKTATPQLSVPSGTYGIEIEVILSVATPGAAIHYTLDGREPTESDPSLASGTPILVDRSTVVSARAFHPALAPSNVASASYVLAVASPVLDPPPASYDRPLTVTVTDATPGAALHYTTNGLEPTEGDPEIVSGSTFFIDINTFLWVKAFRDGWEPSSASGLYRMAVLTPVFDPPPGNYGEEQLVTISVATSGAMVHYTTDGSHPTPLSPVAKHGVPVRIDRSLTLRALGFRADLEASDLAQGNYQLKVAAPIATPPSASGVGPELVVLSTATPGASIRYTLNGPFPDASSPLYVSPVLVDVSSTLQARAFRIGWTPSDLTTVSYDIVPPEVATPRFSIPGGTYATARDVVVTCDTPGAVLRVTTSGLDPTEADPEIASGTAIRIDRYTLLKAKAWKAGAGESALRTAAYFVTGAVSAGANFSLALDADGAVWAWGANDSGQLGNGTAGAAVPAPALVALPVPAVSISAGSGHALAIDADGAVWAWGNNASGQIGDGTIVSRAAPVKVPGLAGIVAVAAGGLHSLALSNDGKLWAWGENGWGRLGDGTTTDRYSPVRIFAVDSLGITAVSAGNGHTLALGRGGALYSWGVNFNGQLGFPPDNLDHPFPRRVSVPPLAAVSGGSFHTIALETGGAAGGRRWYWGGVPGSYGDRYDLTMLDAGGGNVFVDEAQSAWTSSSLAKTLDKAFGPRNVVGVSTGQGHFLAVTADGAVWSWGANGSGELGDGTFVARTEPSPLGTLRLVENVTAGEDPDGDGLSDAEEYRWGSDPRNPDTNGDGIPDGLAVALGLSPVHPDMDGDGAGNAAERAAGTDPFDPDTDDDGVLDGTDCFPLDPSRSACLEHDPSDHEPPGITILSPIGMRLISSIP